MMKIRNTKHEIRNKSKIQMLKFPNKNRPTENTEDTEKYGQKVRKKSVLICVIRGPCFCFSVLVRVRPWPFFGISCMAPFPFFQPRTMEMLMQYSWPGNIRHLDLVVEKLFFFLYYFISKTDLKTIEEV
ncbi:MAG: hypothetical protein QG657_3288 [Acidobacteriota bacterium]|nr:hypothetical protein [Acidobacteriota bacterium]